MRTPGQVPRFEILSDSSNTEPSCASTSDPLCKTSPVSHPPVKSSTCALKVHFFHDKLLHSSFKKDSAHYRPQQGHPRYSLEVHSLPAFQTGQGLSPSHSPWHVLLHAVVAALCTKQGPGPFATQTNSRSLHLPFPCPSQGLSLELTLLAAGSHQGKTACRRKSIV